MFYRCLVPVGQYHGTFVITGFTGMQAVKHRLDLVDGPIILIVSISCEVICTSCGWSVYHLWQNDTASYNFLETDSWSLPWSSQYQLCLIPRQKRFTASGPSTLSVHAGEARVKPGFSITDPIFAASTYTFPDTQAIVDFLEQGQPREEYGRYGNPGERVVEDKLAALDGGEASVLFSSGMAAFVGLLMAHVDAGDDIVFFRRVLSPKS